MLQGIFSQVKPIRIATAANSDRRLATLLNAGGHPVACGIVVVNDLLVVHNAGLALALGEPVRRAHRGIGVSLEVGGRNVSGEVLEIYKGQGGIANGTSIVWLPADSTESFTPISFLDGVEVRSGGPFNIFAGGQFVAMSCQILGTAKKRWKLRYEPGGPLAALAVLPGAPVTLEDPNLLLGLVTEHSPTRFEISVAARNCLPITGHGSLVGNWISNGRWTATVWHPILLGLQVCMSNFPNGFPAACSSAIAVELRLMLGSAQTIFGAQSEVAASIAQAVSAVEGFVEGNAPANLADSRRGLQEAAHRLRRAQDAQTNSSPEIGQTQWQAVTGCCSSRVPWSPLIAHLSSINKELLRAEPAGSGYALLIKH